MSINCCCRLRVPVETSTFRPEPLVAALGAQERDDLLEVIEDRHGERSLVIAGQLPVKAWHKYIGDPAVADAALDRVVHNAHQITLNGESMRKTRSNLTDEPPSAN